MGMGLSVAAMFGCGPCAVGAAAISIGRGIYKVRGGDRSGWLDIAGGAFYGGAKIAEFGGKWWKNRRMRAHPKGRTNGRARAHKRARQKAAARHRSYNRLVVRRANRLDRWYGYGSTAYSAYGGWKDRRR
ncbi:hypothetical protein [Streptomyces sp. NPDC047886]|uniref:hypothetical protein n=1 Tax=Streptomyces sp. NPDC047886 TaxID=3365490 RepID=UPI003710BAB0